ncbi:MAG TPA: hypothetical protein PK077_11085, partial [Akkermansia muciniphila]|nr:hypothetical protein [Akkermansia muciniphila]
LHNGCRPVPKEPGGFFAFGLLLFLHSVCCFKKAVRENSVFLRHWDRICFYDSFSGDFAL